MDKGIKKIINGKMTTERARQLLGEEIKYMTDQEVQEMIRRDSAFMEELLEIWTKGTMKRYNGSRCD